jgi:hypothetical protein
MLMTRRAQAILVTLLVSIGCLAAAPAQVAPSLTDRIPVEREIAIGQLPNGLRYYVRANKKPEKRA